MVALAGNSQVAENILPSRRLKHLRNCSATYLIALCHLDLDRGLFNMGLEPIRFPDYGREERTC